MVMKIENRIDFQQAFSLVLELNEQQINKIKKAIETVLIPRIENGETQIVKLAFVAILAIEKVISSSVKDQEKKIRNQSKQKQNTQYETGENHPSSK